MAKSKQQQLDELKRRIETDKICPELAKQATQLVFGTGDSDADIVFVGEAPGKNEDIQGEPFVGAAGRFLNEMLATIGLERKDIYITNIVKYRPPNNRDPLPEEKSAFLPYLQAQLDIIQPKVVVTLGRHSMNCFLPSVPTCASCIAGGSPEQCTGRPFGAYRKDDVAEATSPAESKPKSGDARSGEPASMPGGRRCNTPLQISKVHGEPKRVKWVLKHGDGDKGKETSLVILPLYHPAAALYNGGMRQTLIDDFAKLPTILEKIKQ